MEGELTVVAGVVAAPHAASFSLVLFEGDAQPAIGDDCNTRAVASEALEQMSSTFAQRPAQAQHPSILQNFHEFDRQATGKRVAVFLDYDGAPQLTLFLVLSFHAFWC